MKRAAFALLLSAGACAPAGLPNRPLPPVRELVRPVPQTFLEELIDRRSVSGVTLRVYNTGSIETLGGAVSSEKSWAAHVTLDAPVFLIRHPKQGLILFDLGLTTSTARALSSGLLTGIFARFESKPGRDIAHQLWLEGLRAEDVRWIILSHLHLDHLGDLGLFPNATVAVSRAEWEGAKRRARAEGPDPKKFDPAPWEGRLRLKLLDFDQAPPFGAFDHGLDLFSDYSVIVVPLPGHTAGSIGAWVNLDGGPVLLAGDAAWVVDNYMDLALPNKRAMKDPSAYLHSLQVIRAMQEAVPRLVVFPGHDLTPLKLTDRDDVPLASH